jgi:hypothetical protein
MRHIAFGLLMAMSLQIQAADSVYVGPWRTTNRKLDGQMTCAVRQLEDNKWLGRFHGVWQGVPFDYTVPFEGESSKLRGTATIDGASYTWTGSIESGVFKGEFGGSRYTGSFELKEKPAEVAIRPRETPATNRDTRR